MRIAICDDDEQELSYLSGLIREYQFSGGRSFECRSFQNGTDFLCDIRGGEYDLVFLDVQMPGISGVQAAQELREADKNVKIVFVSELPEISPESYGVGAYCCLHKPVDVESLFKLLNRVENELLRQEEQGFVLKNRKGVIRLFFSRIEYVEVVNKKVFFYLEDGETHEVTAALSDFEEEFLARPEFLKPHRSYLMNLNYVQTIGTTCITTKNGHNIPVSRLRRNQVQDAYMHFLNQAEAASPVFDRQTRTVSESSGRLDDPWRILLVDDDTAERNFWTDVLKSHGCIVQTAENGEDALRTAADGVYDCVLLDVMIPGEDGFSICERIRKRMMHVPVIFLSCLTESDKQVEGFAAGGIDYITKDTPVELFWAKVETRIKLAASDRTQFQYGPLFLDLAKHRVLMQEKELFLTSIEFDILWRLSERPEHVFTPKEIFDMIWGDQPWDGGQMVQIHVSRLRRKLENAWREHCFIETVWGEGYRFVPVSH